MRISDSVRVIAFRALTKSAILLALSAAATACGSYGDPCLRTTDCASGYICDEGKCIVDPGDNPADGSPPSDVTVPPGDASVGDSATTLDRSVGTDSPSDSAGSDAMRDVALGGDADGAIADSASSDVSRDADAATDVNDDSDARVSTDGGAMTIDAPGVDVGNDADSGAARDALAIADGSDAAG
jgi:hypothetical protein